MRSDARVTPVAVAALAAALLVSGMAPATAWAQDKPRVSLRAACAALKLEIAEHRLVDLLAYDEGRVRVLQGCKTEAATYNAAKTPENYRVFDQCVLRQLQTLPAELTGDIYRRAQQEGKSRSAIYFDEYQRRLDRLRLKLANPDNPRPELERKLQETRDGLADLWRNADDVAVLTDVRGDAELRRAGQWRPAAPYKSFLLVLGDQVRTGTRGSAAILFHGGATASGQQEMVVLPTDPPRRDAFELDPPPKPETFSKTYQYYVGPSTQIVISRFVVDQLEIRSADEYPCWTMLDVRSTLDLIHGMARFVVRCVLSRGCPTLNHQIRSGFYLLSAADADIEIFYDSRRDWVQYRVHSGRAEVSMPTGKLALGANQYVEIEKGRPGQVRPFNQAPEIGPGAGGGRGGPPL
jgi:hypothetical protein